MRRLPAPARWNLAGQGHAPPPLQLHSWLHGPQPGMPTKRLLRIDASCHAFASAVDSTLSAHNTTSIAVVSAGGCARAPLGPPAVGVGATLAWSSTTRCPLSPTCTQWAWGPRCWRGSWSRLPSPPTAAARALWCTRCWEPATTGGALVLRMMRPSPRGCSIAVRLHMLLQFRQVKWGQIVSCRRLDVGCVRHLCLQA